MRIEIEKEWFNKNKEQFAKLGNEELSGEDTDKYYIIDTDKDLFGNQDNMEVISVEGMTLSCSTSNDGLYVSTDCQPKSEQIAELIKGGDIEVVPEVIEVIVKKMNRIKSLLETVNSL